MHPSEQSLKKEGAEALAESLKVNNSLHLLVLFYSHVGNEGAAALAESLKVNNTLTSLDLCGNSIEKEGIVALAESLKDNNTLTNLNFNHDRIRNEQAVAFSHTARNKKIFDKVKVILESIGSSNESDESEPIKIHAFDLKYYQSVNPVIFEFDQQQYNKIKDYINDNFFHLTAMCKKGNPLLGDATDGSALPQLLWDNIFSYLKLSDVVLDAPLPVDQVELLADNYDANFV